MGEVHRGVEERPELSGGRKVQSSACSAGIRVQTHPPPHDDYASVPGPRYRNAFPAQRHTRDAALAPHVPEAAGTVGRGGGQFGFFGRVPGHALDAGAVPAQLRAVFHLRLFWVPDPQRAVRGAGRDVGACGGPGYGADAGEGEEGVSEGGMLLGKNVWEERRKRGAYVQREGRGLREELAEEGGITYGSLGF